MGSNLTEEEREVFLMMGELETRGEISEAIGDNTVDNMIDELKRATGIELGRFVGSLLGANLNTFIHSYTVPQHEEFREIFNQILSRYRVMDGMDQGDLFKKIEIFWKDLFVERYADLGAEVAELVAKRYATQMVLVLKANSIQANVDMDSNRDGVYY